MKRIGDEEVKYGDLHQTPESCSASARNHNYSVACGAFVINRTAKMKNYMLHIKGMQSVDFTEWWCQTTLDSRHYNILTLKESGKLHFSQSGCFYLVFVCKIEFLIFIVLSVLEMSFILSRSEM